MQTGQGHDTRLVRGIEVKMNKAMRDYALIDEGDHVLVGLSGGKDSLALVELLGRRMRVYAPRFRATAVHVSVEHIPYRADLGFLRQHAEEAGMPLEHRTVAYDPTGDRRKSPCFLCSWHRRKALFETARELGCTKIALGHHLDDVVETLLLNMFFQGTTGTMPPRLRMDKFDMTLIRPLCLVPERDLAALAAPQPVGGHGARADGLPPPQGRREGHKGRHLFLTGGGRLPLLHPGILTHRNTQPL